MGAEISPEIGGELARAVAAFVAGGAVALIIVGLLRILKGRRQRSYQDQVQSTSRQTDDCVVDPKADACQCDARGKGPTTRDDEDHSGT